MRSAMRTVEKRWETRTVTRRDSPSPLRAASGVPLEEGMLGLGIESGRGLVEDEEQGLLPHETTRERELLPLSEGNFDAPGPRGTELGFEARPQP